MKLGIILSIIINVVGVVLPTTAFSLPPQASDRAKEAASIKAFWTSSRIATAQPRDLVVDDRGLAYLTDKSGKLSAYGHSIPEILKPYAKGGGNGKPGGGSGSTTGFIDVNNSPWDNGGVVQNAAGRIFFVMGGNGYVCSGTLINDGETSSNRSVILTAAHCVYDDVNKTFAESAIFIPNQANTSGIGTDADCSNDPEGCWVADFGVVSVDWTTSIFPNNIPWDYGYYALGTYSDLNYFSNDGRDVTMDKIITPMEVSFEQPSYNVYTRALGYSYKDDPYFMYCGEPVAASSYDGYLLQNCALSGGASGGPWSQSQEPDLGVGPIISVNSYGPARGKKYMGGPKLSEDAKCLFDKVKSAPIGNTEDIVGCN